MAEVRKKKQLRPRRQQQRRREVEEDWSKFENLLGITDNDDLQQLSDSYSGTPEFDKIYVVATCTNIYSVEKCKSCVYIIDLNSPSHSGPTIDVDSIASNMPPVVDNHNPYDGFIRRCDCNCDCDCGPDDFDPDPNDPDYVTPNIPLLEPLVTWKIGYTGAVAILGSVLYFFGGKEFSTGIWGSHMHIYDLSSTKTSTHIEIESLDSGPNMSGKKAYPVAVVIGDYKICVFARILFHSSSLSPPLVSPPSFELFDTRDCTWTPLPEKPMIDEYLEDGRIESYSVHRSCLVIHICKHGFYGINLDSSSPDWVKLYGKELGKSFPFVDMWAMVDKQLFSPFDLISGPSSKVYPFSPRNGTTDDRESLIELNTSAVLYLAGIHFFLVRGGFSYYDKLPRLLVDIVKFDDEALQKLGTDMDKWQNIQSDKSFAFKLPTPCKILDLMACFPMKVALESGGHSVHRVQAKDGPFDANTTGKLLTS